MLQDEWKIIYEQYYKPLLLYALSLTGNKQDAEDLVQQAFVKAFLSYENTGSIKFWLVKVLKNDYLQMLRKRKKEVLDDEIGVQYQVESGEDLLADIIEQEERRRLLCEIQKLPISMKEVLIESVYFHMSDDEIAKLHSTTCENVRKIRSRAKQKLIEKMNKEGK